MKLKTFVFGVGMLAAVSASAQTVTVPSLSGAPGDTLSATITYENGGSDVSSYQFDIQYDRTNTGVVSFPECPASSGATNGTTNCTVEADGQTDVWRVGEFTVPSAVITSGNVAVFEYTIPVSTPPGTYPLTVVDFAAFDTTGADVTGTFTVNAGDITVSAPPGSGFYSSTPAPGSTLDLGTADVGSATAGAVLSVENLSPDTDFDVTAIGTTAETAVAPGAPQTVPFGGNVDFTFTCTPDARGNNTGSLSVTHDAAAGAPSPVSYDYTCAGTSPNVAVSTTTINLSGVIGGTNPSDTFDITNADDGFTSAATNAALAESGTPEISITDGLTDATISVDETDSVTVECDTTNSGMFSETISLTYDDPAAGGGTGQIDVTVNCDIANAVPSFAGSPAAPGPLNFGTVTNGTTSAPIGIDVSNDGVGPSPASDLNIASATVSDPQFAVTVNDSGPFVVGDPAVADAVEVTCTPDAGTTGSFTGTLTINHNGDDDPTTYNLECAGQTDATFSSTPPDGGNLNLGIVPPVTMTPPGDITFSNGGSADSYDVDCTVTDPDGVFTFSPDPISFTVAPGGSQAATFQCTPAAPQIYQADVACTITGADVASANYTVTCAGQPLVVPTMNRWGLILMALVLLALGGFAGRRMMA